MENVNKQLLDAAKLILEQVKSNSAALNLYTIKALTAAIAAAEQAQQAEPVAWLKYPRKKPELMQVSLSEHLPVALKNSGWVSKPLYSKPPANPPAVAHVPMQVAGKEDRAVYDSIAAGYHQPPAVSVPDVDWLAQVIRAVDGNHSLGAGALAEKIVDAMLAAAMEHPK